MKNIISVLLLSAVLWACSDKYDDERIKREIDDIGEALTEMERLVEQFNSQLASITDLAGSRFVSSISVDADGRYAITYCDRDGEVKTIRLVLGDEVPDSPVIGVGEDSDGVYYWRLTADNGRTWEWLLSESGDKIPVTGATPELSVDGNGYWTVNGRVVTDADGNPVPARDLTDSLFSGIGVDPDTGQAVFTLSDGTVIRCRMFEALGIEFDSPVYTAIEDRSQTVRIRYTITGTEAEDAIVDYFTAYNVTAAIDSGIRTISVKLDDGAESGNLVVMAYSNGTTALKPLFFTYGSAVIQDPELDPAYGSTGDILLDGEATTFEIKVSANIEYEVKVDDAATSWLNYDDRSTRAMVTTSHYFTAGNYGDPSGSVRTGTIRFANRLYDVSTTVTVKQSPSAEGGGISTADDLLAFAAAVNAGASTARWQDDNGEVVLNNDIDMSGVGSWTPAGSATGSYTAVNPFRGTFNGQGYAIYGMEWTFALGGSSGSAFGLFGSLSGATVKNLVLGSEDGSDTFSFTGTATSTTTAGAIAGYSENSTIENCTNYVNMILTGDDAAGVLFSLGGIAGTMKGGIIGGASRSAGSDNYGTVATGRISNEGNGGTGMTVGGICAYVEGASSHINFCTNYGDVSAPTGRGGGLAGTITNGTISNSDNRGTVRDDIVGQYEGKASELTYNNKRMGGLVGGATVNDVVIEYCTNYGDVISSLACRTGGFVGHNAARITGCVNRGAVIADTYVEGNGTNRHGPGWACGYSQASSSTYTNVQGCAVGGRVGDYTTYGNNPSAAPEATSDNAFCHNPGAYDPSINN